MNDACYQGECLCGSIQYETDELDDKMGHCHCTMCRKFHGAAFATFGSAAKADFRWLKGEELLRVYVAENGTKRKFCKQCGSSMVFESSEGNGLVEFSLATLDSIPNSLASKLRPDAHIYTNTKVDWVNINDDLPKFDNGRHEQG